jgi:hypothetical protein
VAWRALLPCALAAALTGCGAQEPEPAPAPRLAAEVKQYRSDIAKRTVAVSVDNPTDGDVLVQHLELDAAGFADPSAEVEVQVAAGSRVDVRLPYGEVECDDDRPAGADTVLLGVQDADGTQHDLRLELAPGGLLDRLHARECADQTLLAVADVRLSSQWTRDGSRLVGALVLERRSGSAPVTVVEPGGNVLFTVRSLTPGAAGTPMGTLAPTASALALPLQITSTRCDAHAFADSKRSYVFGFYVALGGDEPQLTTTTADPPLQRQLDRLAADTCRPGG